MKKIILSNLPTDIIYNICKLLNIVDICKLNVVNKEFFNKISRIQSDLLSYELRLQKDFINCEYFYHWLNTYLSTHLCQYKQLFYKDYHCFYKHINLVVYIKNLKKQGIQYIRPISSYQITNTLFDKIFTFYINNNLCNINKFQNKLLLFTFYTFLKIEYYPNSNSYDLNHRLNFLEQNKYSINVDDLKVYYYNSILYKFHYKDYVPITFEQMYTISHYVTSIPVIKKLIGYKLLNLENTLLNLCCYDCNETTLIEICNTKRTFWKDDLISYNYTQLKKMLQRTNPYYYHFLCNRETAMVNSMIYIKNPITNRRVRVNKTIYNNLIRDFEKYRIEKITNYITNQRNYLKKKFFD